MILIFIPGETVGLYCTVLLLKFYLEFCIPFCLCSLPLCLILILEYITDRLSQHFSFFLQEKKKKKGFTVSQYNFQYYSIGIFLLNISCLLLELGNRLQVYFFFQQDLHIAGESEAHLWMPHRLKLRYYFQMIHKFCNEKGHFPLALIACPFQSRKFTFFKIYSNLIE